MEQLPYAKIQEAGVCDHVWDAAHISVSMKIQSQ